MKVTSTDYIFFQLFVLSLLLFLPNKSENYQNKKGLYANVRKLSDQQLLPNFDQAFSQTLLLSLDKILMNFYHV